MAYTGRMEFEKAKQILNNEKVNKYTDQEIKEIVQILDVFVDVWITNGLKKEKE